MNFMTKALSGLAHWMQDLFTSDDARKRALATLDRAGQIAAQLYPIVKQVAALTPNRTDDQILAAIDTFGLAGIVDPNLPDKAGVLHEIVLAVARRVAPTEASSVLSLAIETAYQILKANAQPKAK